MEEEESLALPALSPRLNCKRTKNERKQGEEGEEKRKSIKEKESESQFKYSPTPQL